MTENISSIYDCVIAPFAEFSFMRRALVASLALSLSAAPLGVFLTLRRMSLMGDAFNCMDTGGWFMTFKATAVIKEMDLASKDVDLLIKAVTQKINGGENGLSDRNILTKKAIEILK